MKNQDTLLIIDGHNLLFQMFYGMPNRIVNHQGKAIQGVIGFVGALRKIIKQTNPTHLVVLFDGEHENPRTELLPEYKGNRIDYSQVEEEDNPFSQLEDVYRALDAMGIRYCETENVETDDVIASYAYKYGKDMKIVISSWDSDFFQLIRENVRVLRYRGKCTCICDRAYINEKFDIEPELYADFKSLVGDTADNIRGAQKVGPKTAAQLLEQFGSLEQVLEKAELISKNHIRQSILQDRDRLRINYQLICLKDSAVVPFTIDELEYNCQDRKTNDILTEINLL